MTLPALAFSSTAPILMDCMSKYTVNIENILFLKQNNGDK
jgi:hypothetical protein